MHSSTLTLISALLWGWVVNATPRPLYPRKRPGTHCIGKPQDRFGRVRNIPPPPGFDPHTVQPHTDCQYMSNRNSINFLHQHKGDTKVLQGMIFDISNAKIYVIHSPDCLVYTHTHTHVCVCVCTTCSVCDMHCGM